MDAQVTVYSTGGWVRQHPLLLPRLEVSQVGGDCCQIPQQIPPGLKYIENMKYKYLQLDEKRIYVYNTLFNLPEIYLLACLIDYFQTNKNYKE